MRQLGAKGLELSSSALENATKQGSAETFALVRPSATNGHRGVYLYLDEVGLLKSLPPTRAPAGLARACGFDGGQFLRGHVHRRRAKRAEPHAQRGLYRP